MLYIHPLWMSVICRCFYTFFKTHQTCIFWFAFFWPALYLCWTCATEITHQWNTPGFPCNQVSWNHNLTVHCSYSQNWSSLHLVSKWCCVVFRMWPLPALYLKTPPGAVGGDEGWSQCYPYRAAHCYCFPNCRSYYHLNKEKGVNNTLIHFLS